MGFWRTNAATRFWTSGDAEACSHDESVVPLFMCVAVVCAHKSCFLLYQIWSAINGAVFSRAAFRRQTNRLP